MATAKQILQLAASQVGITEQPPNSNRTKYGAWYGMDGEPWCDMFVSWLGDQVGQTDIGKFAYCPYHVTHFKSKGLWLGRIDNPEPGDIIFFANKGTACHVGIVVEKLSNGYIRTIEGNTSVASNDNGGAVMVRDRAFGTVGSSWYILGFARPKYSKEGWVYDGKGWWYEYEDGSWPYSCWKKFDGIYYYFDDNGYALSSTWKLWEGDWYYLRSNCEMAVDWWKIGSNWYHFDNSGKMKTGWLKDDGYWYYFNDNGAMQTGIVDIDEMIWAFDTNGRMYNKMNPLGYLTMEKEN